MGWNPTWPVIHNGGSVMDNQAVEQVRFGGGGARPLYGDPVHCPTEGLLPTAPYVRKRRVFKVDENVSSPGARWRWLIEE